MIMPIGKTLKGLSLAAILLAVPAFAVFGLFANASHRSSSAELSAEHDPLRQGFGAALKPRANSQASAPNASTENDLRDWTFTSKPVPSPTPSGLGAAYGF